MGSYILRRLIMTIPILLVVSFLVFSMMRLLPGDPARIIAGIYANDQLVEQIRRSLGLDQPFLVQYVRYISKAITGDFGRSIWTHEQVAREIALRYLATIQLATAGIAIASVGGILLGVISAVKRDTLIDQFFLLFSVSGMSIPSFWLGLVLLVYLAGKVGLFPIGGSGSLLHLILPAIALAVRPMAMIARLMRTDMVDVLNQGYIYTARAKGLSERAVVYRHALKNAILPTLTVVGLEFGELLGGVIVIETVFAWPGLGRLLIAAIMSRDFPVVQGVVLLMALIFAVSNLVVDIGYALLDPRITYD